MTNLISKFVVPIFIFLLFGFQSNAQCPIGTTLVGNANNFQFYGNVLNAANALGAPNGAFTNNIVGTSALVLDLTDFVPPGQSVDLHLRKLVANGTIVAESSPDGFNYYDAVDLGAIFAINTPFTATLNVTVPTRYIRISIRLGSMQVDAVSYDFCPDTDNDGTTDSDENNNGTDPTDPCDPFYIPVFYLDCDGDGVSNVGETSTNGQNPCIPSNSANACDADGDSVSDADDRCPNTPLGTIVNSIGCETTSVCQYTPPTTTVFTPSLVWSGINLDGRETALIGDVTGDGVTDVVADNYINTIYVLNGQTGATQYAIPVGTMNQNHSANAIGDVDSDGYGEIFTLLADRTWVRLDFDGTAWTQQAAGGLAALAGNNKYVPGLADFDGDGVVELFSGSQIWRTAFDGTPADLLATGGINYADLGGAVAIDMLPDAACADCQGLELVMTGRVFSVNLATATITMVRSASTLPGAALAMRATSVADMDGDGDYDIVFPYLAAGQTRVVIWDGQTNTTMLNYQLNTIYPRGGRINIADFDGDGELEMGLHFGGQGIVSQGNAPGQYGIVDDIINSPGGAMLWVIGTNDYSGITGSTVFDFDGDGIYEVVYRDQTSLRILNGRDGFVKYMTPCTSGTRWEYPVVADVNDDGETNLICTCRDVGLSAFASANDPWIPSRGVWNQHGYNVTNVNDDLTIPMVPNSNITTSNGLLNNFLVQSPRLDSSGQVEELGTTDSDITSIEFGPNFDCSAGVFQYEMTIINLGDKDMPSDFWYTVYDGNPEAAAVNVLVTDTVGMTILPLDSLTITFSLNACPVGALYAVLNDPGTIPTPYDIALDFPLTNEDECDYLNNTHVLECKNPPPQNNTYGPFCQGTSLPDTVTTVLAVAGHSLYWYDNDPTTTGVLIGTGISIDPSLFANINLPGIYTAYVTEFDPNNLTLCESIAATVTVTVVSNPTVTATITQTIDCKDNCNGAISVAVSNGTAPYTYTWSGPTVVGNTGVGNSLCDGTYNITVTDNNGCFGTTSIILTEPTLLTVSANINAPVSCNGLSDGVGTATAAGGTIPYVYSWDNGNTNPTASNLDAGIHTVVVTDGNGCTATAFASITEPLLLNVAVVQNSPVVCNGESNGSATATPTGGTTPYSYNWDNSETTPTATSLNAGSHTVTITDDNGCETTGTVVISQPTMLTVTAVQVQPVSCNGASDGQATANIGGGIAPYTISWDNAETTTTASNLNAGTHTLTVTDTNGCTATSSVTITENSSIGISAVLVSAVVCNGESNGSATATGFGGLPPYSYNWDNTETTPTATGLNAGTHAVSVTDVNGCQAITAVVITEPALLSGQAIQNIPVSCNGLSNGVATASATGGVLPYTYNWDNGANTPVTSNLDAGTHNVTISDANNCISVQTVVISEPTLLNTTVAQNIAVVCNGESNGTATASPTGGVTPYSYNWDNNETTATATQLNAGTHLVTVTDTNGCQVIGTILITEPTLLTLSAVQDIPVSCNGESDGQSTATFGGGIAPYVIIWDNGETTTIATNLNAGTHTLTVTDINGCTATSSVTITENSTVGISAVQVSAVVCNGESNGNATATGTGGLPPYSYIWDNTETTATATGLAAGTHSVSVTDVNGCQAITTVVITEPALLSGQAIQNIPVSCNGLSDGVATASATGGVLPYAYIWDNGAMTAITSNLNVGTHSVTISDANNCTSVHTVIITEPTILSTTVTQNTDVVCNGESNGTATASPTGGITPYSYNWDNNETTATATQLNAGTHLVTVTDTNGCQVIGTIQIAEPTLLMVSAVEDIPVSCNGLSDGQSTATISGGITPYSILWDNNETTTTASALNAGIHSLTVTDGNGCTAVTTVAITENQAISASASQDIAVICFGESNGVATVTATGGLAPYTYLWDNTEVTTTATGLNVGMHSVSVTDVNGCLTIATVTITEPSALNGQALQIQGVSCNGLSDGAANITVIGGVPPYIYLWDNGEVSATATMLAGGAHSATITDQNNCVKIVSLSIFEPAALQLNCSEQAPISAPNQTDGIGLVDISGGTSVYNIDWDNGVATGSQSTTVTGPAYINNLAPGNYNVTVTDGNGCAETCSFSITDFPCTAAISAIQQATPISCNGNCNGSINLSITSMSIPITYTWSGPVTIGNIEDPTGLCAGTYFVVVTDGNGCQASSSITLAQPTQLSLICTEDSGISAPNQTDGVGSVDITGGVSPYTIDWDNGTTTGTQLGATGINLINNLAPGNYSVSVTDTNGCIEVCGFSITDILCTATVFAMQSDTSACFGDCTGGIVLTVNNAAAPITYQWNGPSPIGNTPNATNLCVGTYYVTMIDANGCADYDSITVVEPLELTLVCAEDTGISAPNQTDAIGSVNINGGSPPFLVNWTGAGTSGNYTATTNGQSLINNLGAGTYNIIVTDANGCTQNCSFTVNGIPCTATATAAQTATILCNGDCTGAIALTIANMTSPITYTWSGPTTIGNIQNPTNLCAGTYSVNAVDANNCATSVSITISEPPLLTLSCSQISGTTAPNQADGIGSVDITGGVGPFSLYWTSGTFSGSAVTPNTGPFQVTGLPSGNYNVTVTDVNFCETICSFSISDVPCAATATITQTASIDCFGDCSGALTVSTGGNATGPFNYSWAGPTAIANTASPSNLCSGTYFVNVIDANGCIASSSITISEPDVLVVNCQLDSMISAPGQMDAVGGVEILGGSPPFTLEWDNGTTVDTLYPSTNGNTQVNGLGAGTYDVTVTDQNGCLEYCSFVVPEVLCQAAISDESILPISCYNECTGAIFLILSNATEPVTFNWSGPTTIGDEQFPTDLCSGNYSVTITDANDCVDTKTFELENPDPVEFSVGDNLYLEQDETAVIQVTTTVPEAEFYDFYWNNTEYISCFECLSPEISPYETTDYSATLIDDNGCMYTDTMTAFVNSGIFIPNIFTPNGDRINDVLFIQSRDDLEVIEFNIYSRWGELVYSGNNTMTNDASVGWNGTFKGKNANQATYTYYARIMLNTGAERLFTGDITLIR